MSRTPDNFDPIARYQDFLTRLVFGKSWRDSQTIFLKTVPKNSRILIVGGGSGFWLPELLSLNPAASICFVDTSRKMIDLARKNAKDDPRITFIHGPVQTLSEKDFDCVITFYFLDVFPERELDNLLTDIGSLLKPQATWIVTDFVNKKWWHGPFLSLMYLFFRITTNLRNTKLPHWEAALIKKGFQKTESRTFYGMFMKASVLKRA